MTSSKEQAKIPHTGCLSRINTEDDDQTAFVKAIATDAEQDNINEGSQGWQLDKLQRVKLQDSKQIDILLKELYSWVLFKTKSEPRQIKNEASKSYGNTGSGIQIFVS